MRSRDSKGGIPIFATPDASYKIRVAKRNRYPVIKNYLLTIRLKYQCRFPNAACLSFISEPRDTMESLLQTEVPVAGTYDRLSSLLALRCTLHGDKISQTSLCRGLWQANNNIAKGLRTHVSLITALRYAHSLKACISCCVLTSVAERQKSAAKDTTRNLTIFTYVV